MLFFNFGQTKSAPPQPKKVEHGRRRFLQRAGIGLAASGLLLSACDDDDDGQMIATVNLGTGDVGILNYAYALEQLEAAFYAQVLLGGYYAGASADERAIFADLEAHERNHREFFRTAIDAVATPIPGLQVDFSSVNFNDRSSVLATAQTFEDLGVSAYNGAGQYLENPDYLLMAGKIVSVEARHASVIRDLNSTNPQAFANNVGPNGLGLVESPTDVLAIASTYIVTPIDASGLPG